MQGAFDASDESSDDSPAFRRAGSESRILSLPARILRRTQRAMHYPDAPRSPDAPPATPDSPSEAGRPFSPGWATVRARFGLFSRLPTSLLPDGSLHGARHAARAREMSAANTAAAAFAAFCREERGRVVVDGYVGPQQVLMMHVWAMYGHSTDPHAL